MADGIYLHWRVPYRDLVESKIVLSTQELVWLPDRLSLAFCRLIEYFPDISLYSIAVSLVSMDTRECNLNVRLEHWTIILDFPFCPVPSEFILVLCSIVRLLGPCSILNWLDDIPQDFSSVYGIILSSSVALTQLIIMFWDFGFKSMCVKSRIVSRVLEHLWWQQITR
jgi:hypothetical protein